MMAVNLLPNFIVIGAAKAGTTSLFHYLSDHPQVFMSAVKEPDFFLADSEQFQSIGRPGRPTASPGSRSARGREAYAQLFAGAGDARAVGEASVRYSAHPFRPGVPGRIAALIPDAKLIYLVRDPVARMVSQWVHNVCLHVEARPLAKALLSPRHLMLSSYAYQIERYLEHFPRDQLLILTSEALRADQQATLGQIWDFLGVPGHTHPSLAAEFNRSDQRWMPRPAIRRLSDVRGTRRLARVMPATVTQATRPLTHVPVRTPTLPPELERDLHALLRDDVARLRRYMEPSFDGWGIG